MWPTDHVRITQDDPGNSPQRNVFGGYHNWVGGGLNFFRQAVGQHESKPNYSNKVINAAASWAAIAGPISALGAGPTQTIALMKQGHNLTAGGTVPFSDPLGIHPIWDYNTTESRLEVPGLDYFDIGVIATTGTRSFALLSGTYMAGDTNITWEPVTDHWVDGSIDGNEGELGPPLDEHPWQKIPEDTGGAATCGTPNADPTLFVTLSWPGSAAETTHNIDTLTYIADGGNHYLDVAFAAPISPIPVVGDTLSFGNTSVRQVINKGENMFDAWKIVSVTGLNHDVRVQIYDRVTVLDANAGTIAHTPTETKSWLGCTWANNETKEVYAHDYIKGVYTTFSTQYTRELWRAVGFANDLAMYREHFNYSASSFAGRVRNDIHPIGQSFIKDFQATYRGTITATSYNEIGILGIGDVGAPGNAYLLSKQKSNAFTDTNSITYSWTEGNGW